MYFLINKYPTNPKTRTIIQLDTISLNEAFLMTSFEFSLSFCTITLFSALVATIALFSFLACNTFVITE
jgi:hypothetical protein